MKLWPIVVVVVGMVALGGARLARQVGAEATAAEVRAKLDAVPATVAGWTSTPVPLREKDFKGTEAVAALSRQYLRPDGKVGVNVLVLAGPPGPLGAHDPETCFPGAGYKIVPGKTKRAVPGRAAEFWSQRFDTSDVPPATVLVTWGWGADGQWAASDNARLDFAGRGLIYKLYLSRVVPPSAAVGGPDPTDEFLAAFLPELDRLTAPR
jgi:hypothetical protein